MEWLDIRKMKTRDFFKLGDLKETDKNAFTGDSVFIKMDTSLQGTINHIYQRICLFLSLVFGKSPIKYHAVVAVDRGRLAGVAWMRFTSEKEALVGVFVNPSHRKKGIGTKLVNGLIELADKYKINMTIIYNEKNPAVKIFKKSEFKIDSKICKMVRNVR